MFKAFSIPAIAAVFLVGIISASLAATGQFDNMCTMGLALGKEVKTDCSINETVAGLSYCFGDQNAKTMFMKDPEGNLAKANANYSKMKH